MTRMLYYSPSNGMWGEYEMDYVLIARKDVQLDVNANEISEVQSLVTTVGNVVCVIKSITVISNLAQAFCIILSFSRWRI